VTTRPTSRWRALKLAPASPLIADTPGWIRIEKGDTQEGLELEGLLARGKSFAEIERARALLKLLQG
jgi:hypothetical protein